MYESSVTKAVASFTQALMLILVIVGVL
ncbi:hypothetical protein DFAR_3630007 [Desulfarculales bacterium]